MRTAVATQAPDRWRILSIDRGSSSLKIAVYELGQAHKQQLLEGGVESIGATDVTLWMRDCRNPGLPEIRKPVADAAPTAALLAGVKVLGVHIDAVGHWLVFGGRAHELPERVTAELTTSLDALVPFDPLHLPDALARSARSKLRLLGFRKPFALIRPSIAVCR